MRKIALISGLTFLVLVLAIVLGHYIGGRMLIHPSYEYYVLTLSVVPAALLALIVYLPATFITMIQTIQRTISPVWAVFVILPAAILGLSVVVGMPRFLDGISEAYKENVTLVELLEFARKVRADKHHNACLTNQRERTHTLFQRCELPDALNNAIPEGMRTTQPLYADVEADHVRVSYGPRKGIWGLMIYDAESTAPSEGPVDTLLTEHRKVFDRVWAYELSD